MANTKEAEKDCTVLLSDLRKLKGAGKKAWPLSWVVPLVSSRRPPAVTVAVPSRVTLAPEKPEKTNWSLLALTASTRLKPWNSRIWRRKESVIFMKGADVSIIIQALVLDIPHLHYSFLGALYPLSQLLIHCANARAPNQLTHVDHPVEFA
uniref:Uncharacterized protein n=1 Tax=Oryza punctata TaxID=4537 RepID=A0A0E0LGX2_ORYPU